LDSIVQRMITSLEAGMRRYERIARAAARPNAVAPEAGCGPVTSVGVGLQEPPASKEAGMNNLLRNYG
jgi:hypothetical protein